METRVTMQAQPTVPTKVFVKPVPSKKWHGKADAEAFQRPTTIRALYDSDWGGYATGLTEEQTKTMEQKTGLNLSNRFGQEPHEFWDSNAGKIILQPHTSVWQINRDIDYIKVAVMKASKFVANSLQEWEDGLYPEATHYIYDEGEEISVKASKLQRKNSAIAGSMKMSLEDKIDIATILSTESMKGRSQDFIDVEIAKLIEQDPDKFIATGSMDREHRSLKALITNGILAHTISKQAGVIKYFDTVLGTSVDEAVAYLRNPDNQAIKIAIMDKLSM